jgi:hypothetical protein
MRSASVFISSLREGFPSQQSQVPMPLVPHLVQIMLASIMRSIGDGIAKRANTSFTSVGSDADSRMACQLISWQLPSCIQTLRYQSAEFTSSVKEALAMCVTGGMSMLAPFTIVEHLPTLE